MSSTKAEVDQFSSSNSKKFTPSVKFIVGVATGSLALVGLAAVVVGVVVRSKRRKRNYETVPLLTEG